MDWNWELAPPLAPILRYPSPAPLSPPSCVVSVVLCGPPDATPASSPSFSLRVVFARACHQAEAAILAFFNSLQDYRGMLTAICHPYRNCSYTGGSGFPLFPLPMVPLLLRYNRHSLWCTRGALTPDASSSLWFGWRILFQCEPCFATCPTIMQITIMCQLVMPCWEAALHVEKLRESGES